MVPKILGYTGFEGEYRHYLEFDIEFPDVFRRIHDSGRFISPSEFLDPGKDKRLVGIRPKKMVRIKIFMEIVFIRAHNRKYLNWKSVYYLSGSTCENNTEINTFADRRKLRLRDPEKFLEEVLDNIKPSRLVSYFDSVLIWWYRTRLKTTKEN